MKKQCYEFKLYKLPYEFNALEPHIDARTMELHHNRHLAAYTSKLNAALKPYPELHHWSLERLLCNINNLPVRLRTDIRNNAGGVYNHIYYFEGLRPSSGEAQIPRGLLGKKIDRCFGSFEQFRERFKECAIELFGSGYLWLVADKRGSLRIVSTCNQDSPITKGLVPIMTLDLWEHSYYLKHYNDRANYVDDWFAVLNAEFAERNYYCCVN